MAEKKEESTAGTLDAAAVSKLIADAIKPLADALKPIQENQKVIADTMAADAKAKSDAEAATKAEAAKKATDVTSTAAAALTPEAIQKLVADSISTTLKAQAEAAKGTAARDAYITEKLKGVPAAYHGKLGSDPAKWADEEQSIRNSLKADLEALGVKAKDVSGDAAGATASTAATTERVAQYKASGLSDGEAAFATNIKLPG